MRYRLDVVAPTVRDAVSFAGGWIYDRVMAGWDVTVLLGAEEDARPLEILGAEVRDLETVLASWQDRPHPQTVAIAADLFDRDPRVHQHVLNALEQGATEVTLWGERLPAELDESVDSVEHHLSAAARAFKMQALAACDSESDVARSETFRCGMMVSVAADLVPAS
ncbi:MAG TPA: hypothetical protein VE666_15480 [Mycobacterium sp.]|jgi:hypothetical protein|nr:hypothetical protein [Mycobacterium sp.]